MDPRKQDLSRIAEKSLQFTPGADVALLNAMINTIVEEGLVDRQYIEKNTEGYKELKEHIKDFTNGDGTRLKSRFGVMERWPGQASGIHGGRMAREEPATTFSWQDAEQQFHCQQVSVLLALNDCPLNGGNTSVVVSAKDASHSAATFA